MLTSGVPVRADNSLANFDFHNQGVCGPRSDRSALWYEVAGTGDEVTISVCSNNGVITDFGVFPECNSQVCVAATQQYATAPDCGAGESIDVSFATKNKERYFVHVRADVVDGVGSDFNITYYGDDSAGDDEPGVEDDELPADDDVDSGSRSASAVWLSVAGVAVAVSHLLDLL